MDYDCFSSVSVFCFLIGRGRPSWPTVHAASCLFPGDVSSAKSRKHEKSGGGNAVGAPWRRNAIGEEGGFMRVRGCGKQWEMQGFSLVSRGGEEGEAGGERMGGGWGGAARPEVSPQQGGAVAGKLFCGRVRQGGSDTGGTGFFGEIGDGCGRESGPTGGGLPRDGGGEAAVEVGEGVFEGFDRPAGKGRVFQWLENFLGMGRGGADVSRGCGRRIGGSGRRPSRPEGRAGGRSR